MTQPSPDPTSAPPQARSASERKGLVRQLVPKRRRRLAPSHRRGSAYLVVLGVSLIVSALAYGGILVTRARNRITNEVADAAEARQYSRDAVEICKLWIQNDANWRTNRTDKTWADNVALGNGSITIKVKDPVDNDLLDWPHDPLELRVTGQKGNAKHDLEMYLEADAQPLPALQYAVHTPGQIRIASGKTFNAGGGTVSTNGTLNNGGTIIGNVEAALALPVGTVTGSVSILSLLKPVPEAAIIDKYAAIGQLINATSLDGHALGAGNNPFSGGKNDNGIYVVRPGGDFTIRNSRIHGTLVVICASGRKVIVENSVLMQPYHSDAPALLVKGDADIQFTSGAGMLREADFGVTFNPNGMPYDGVSNNTKNDVYPSEIQGLVHVTGKVSLAQTSLIRGALFSNSTATLLSNAISITDSASVIYTPSLMLNPPCWYTTSVPMVVQRGSWKQK